MIDPDFFNHDAEGCGTKGLLYSGDKLIIIRRDNNTSLAPCLLDLPGGTRESGESAFETFVREIHEELGLTITRDDIVFAKRYPDVFYEGKRCFIVATRPLSITPKDIHFGSEGVGYYFMRPEEFIAAPDAIPGYQAIVADILEDYKI